jgi:hypothetical protein
MFVSCSLPEFIPVIYVLFHDLQRLSLMWPGKHCLTISISMPHTCLCAWLSFLSYCLLITLNAKLIQCKLNCLPLRIFFSISSIALLLSFVIIITFITIIDVIIIVVIYYYYYYY